MHTAPAAAAKKSTAGPSSPRSTSAAPSKTPAVPIQRILGKPQHQGRAKHQHEDLLLLKSDLLAEMNAERLCGAAGDVVAGEKHHEQQEMTKKAERETSNNSPSFIHETTTSSSTSPTSKILRKRPAPLPPAISKNTNAFTSVPQKTTCCGTGTSRTTASLSPKNSRKLSPPSSPLSRSRQDWDRDLDAFQLSPEALADVEQEIAERQAEVARIAQQASESESPGRRKLAQRFLLDIEQEWEKIQHLQDIDVTLYGKEA